MEVPKAVFGEGLAAFAFLNPLSFLVVIFLFAFKPSTISVDMAP